MALSTVPYFHLRSKMEIRVFVLILLVFYSSLVARGQSDPEAEMVEEMVAVTEKGGDLGIVGDDVQDGIETVCVFPKNPSKVVIAGEESELLVGMQNYGESSASIIAIRARLHRPYSHSYLVKNLSTQAFNNATVPPSVQAAFSYIFAVSKYMKPGSFDLVGTIIYKIDQNLYENVFYNGTIKVKGPVADATFVDFFLINVLVTLVLLLLHICWRLCQRKYCSKKTERAPKAKVEVGTATTDALEGTALYATSSKKGTAYAQSLSNKSKKKK